MAGKMEEKSKGKGNNSIEKVGFILEQADETKDKKCFSCGKEGGEMLSIKVAIHCNNENGNKDSGITKMVYEIKCCQLCLDEIMGICEDEETDLVFPPMTKLLADETNPAGCAA